jgi:hypothetical protein
MADKISKSKIQFVYYLKTYKLLINNRSVVSNLTALKDCGVKIEPQDYNTENKGKYFCPKCGVPCCRRPEKKYVQRDGKYAYFAHNPGYDDVICEWRTYPSQGQNFESERVVQEARQNEVVLFSKWSDIDECEELNGEATIYEGTSENPNSSIKGASINRHTGDKYHVPQIISSLRTIASNFQSYLGKMVRFPGWDSPVFFNELIILTNNLETASFKSNSSPTKEYLFVGQVHKVNYWKSVKEKKEYFFINLVYTNKYKVSFKCPAHIFYKRKWTKDNMAHKVVIGFGKLKEQVPVEDDVRVEIVLDIDAMGKIATIPDKFIGLIEKTFYCKFRN